MLPIGIASERPHESCRSDSRSRVSSHSYRSSGYEKNMRDHTNSKCEIAADRYAEHDGPHPSKKLKYHVPDANIGDVAQRAKIMIEDKLPSRNYETPHIDLP